MPEKVRGATLNAQYFFHPELVGWIIIAIIKMGLWFLCLQEAPEFQRKLLEQLVKDPRLEGKWDLIQLAIPDKMGHHQGLVTLYRKDKFQLKNIKEIWLSKSPVSPDHQVALETTFQYKQTNVRIVNLRLAYEPKNCFRLQQMQEIADNLNESEDLNTIVCGDSNLRWFSQLTNPLGWLSLILPIPSRLVVENWWNRRKMKGIFPSYRNLVPYGSYTIDPFRSLPPNGIPYKINQQYRKVNKTIFGRPRNIRLLLQLDYFLVKGLIARFVDILHTTFTDHSMVVCEFEM